MPAAVGGSHYPKQERLSNRVKHMHYEVIGYLLRRYVAVICPRYATNPTDPWFAKAMNHYKFRLRLQSAQEGYRDPVTKLAESRMVWFCKENGTSRTCGHCGRWLSDLGAGHTYKCPSCGVHIGRDINGAHNNMLAPATALLGFAPNARRPLTQA